MTIPEIAVLGHPNEGKSSVLSTLAEDDSVRVSPIPGETTECRTFPVIIDSREVLRFTDTPGFQHPARLLAELRTFSGTSDSRLQKLQAFTASHPELRDDHELLRPVERGAGIIYVVDGSRPVRAVDRAEMEILRLIGRPRMAVLNCKDEDDRYLESWKDEFRKHFNSSRVFNAHRATYAERLDLLEALKAIDQDWHPVLATVVDAFKRDWSARTRTSAAIICSLLRDCLSLQLVAPIATAEDEAQVERRLLEQYSRTIVERETAAHQQIRALFKHNIFDCRLPPRSILHEELFSEKTWQLFGLTKKQMVLLGGLSGAAVGAGIDVAALGHGLGLFTAIGGVVGSLGAFVSRSGLSADASLLGVRIAGPQLTIGPAISISLLFVLLNRAFLYYRHTINWAHGRRDYPATGVAAAQADTTGFTRTWPPQHLRSCQTFLKAMRQPDTAGHQTAENEMQELLFTCLMKIARDDL